MQNQNWQSNFSPARPERKPYNLITGANGFIGSAVCRKMLSGGLLVKGTVRSQKGLLGLPHGVISVLTGSLGSDTQWDAVLQDVDTVIHAAGPAHRTGKTAKKNPADFHSVNVLGTECLARASVRAGVRRFIYLSSIGVNGEFTKGSPFTENDAPYPAGAYAVSKWEAEQALRKIAEDAGMDVVILRSPLVYGANAPGNFGRLMRLIKIGLPLPLGNIKNLRSFIYIGNLVDVISRCIEHPSAVGQVFLVSDGEDLSITDLIRLISREMGKSALLFSLPYAFLDITAKTFGRDEELKKLIGPMRIDISKLRNLLKWKPPWTMEEGIMETVKWIEIASPLRGPQ